MFFLKLVVTFLTMFAAAGASFAAVSPKLQDGPAKATGPGTSSGISAGTPTQKQKKFKEGELLVKFKPGTTEEHKKNLHAKHGSEKVKEFSELRLHHVKLKKGMTVEEGVKRYREDPDVEYAEPNFLYFTQGDPGDPRFGELWGLRNTGQTGGTAGADIKATAAWDITTGSGDVVVAIIDTGIDYTHPDLVDNLWVNVGIDTVNQDSDPFDDNGHGTHVAGTIGAVGANGTGVVGVNWNVRLTACKFLNAAGSGATDGAVQCLQYIKNLKDAGANIVATSNSWGGGGYSQALYDAISAQRDILFIAAAGNNGADMDGYAHYPSSYDLPNIIAVAATDHKDVKAVFSNYGRRTAHISAPGAKILSTLPATNEWNISGGYGFLSGTSMATPHVTGLAALLKAQDPARNWIAIKNLILSGGDPVTNMYERTITGKRINTYGSLTCSGSKVFSALDFPASLTIGTPVTLSALSISCDLPSGPVTVTLSGGETVTLSDDGVAPDLAAGDGIFAASWTPVRTIERLRFSSAAGAETIEYPSLTISTTTLPSLVPNRSYRQRLFVGGGYFPYSWSIVGGALPAGIALDSASGELSGTPAVPGASHFSVQLSDAYGAKVVKDYSLNVLQPDVYEAWTAIMDTNTVTTVYDDASVGKLVDIAVDTSGNSYVTRPGYVLIGDTWTPAMFVRKYDASGNEVWTDTASFVSAMPSAIAVDKDGFVYVGGNITSQSQAYLLVKYSPQGNLIWSRQIPKTAGEVKDVATDQDGNVYFTCHGIPGFLTYKYDSSGNQLWSRTLLPARWNSNLTTDRSGNLYVAGYEEFGDTVNIVLAKYDAAGTILWSKTYDFGAKEVGQDVAVDTEGNVYVTGWTMGSPASLLLIKTDGSGNLIWNKSYSAGNGTKGFGLAMAGTDILVAGSYQGTPYDGTDFTLLKYDNAGNLLWSMNHDSGETERGERVAVARNGDILVAGGIGAGIQFTRGLILKYDLSIPTTSASPAAGTYDSGPTVVLTADEPATIYYTVDGSTPTTGSSVYSGPLTIPASATIRYFAVDSVGHSEPVKSATYVILPSAVVSGVPESRTNVTDATLTVGGTGVSRYKYKLDGGSYTGEFPIATPIALSGLSEGQHVLSVVGGDEAGNWQVAPTVAVWTVDLTPPSATVIAPAVTSASVSFTVSGSDVVAYRFRVDTGSYSGETPAGTRIIISSLASGAHILEVVGRDSAGNWQPVPTTHTWTVDAFPVTVQNGPAYGSIAEAYAAVPDDGVLLVKDVAMMEEVIFNRNVRFTLRGGYNPGTGMVEGVTTFYGVLEVRDGTVTIENIVIAPPT